MSRGPAVFVLLVIVSTAAEDPLREAARLDAAGKCDEAERYYQEALAARPSSAMVRNNAGNHYLVCGQPEKARIQFEALLKIQPSHANANLQLARMAAERKQGIKALEHLTHVKDTSAPVRLIRAEALHWAGQRSAALALVDEVDKSAAGDARLRFMLALACARMGLYDRAESAFQAVLAQRPGDFSVLFNLGRAAALAKHYDRAQRALESAIEVRPGDIEAYVELGRVLAARQDYSRAVWVLAQARQRAPTRPDVLLSLAQAARDAGYYGDSALAYDEYLRVAPRDETVRRDRALMYGLTGSRLQDGVRELNQYLRRHPDDPIAHFYLAQLLWKEQPEETLGRLSAAVRLDANFAAARFARAWLLNRLGRTSEALPDYQAAARLSGRNAQALDQLGLAYLTLDQPAQAEKVLRQALEIAPENPQVRMHLGRALMALGREDEARSHLEAFQKLRPQRVRDPRTEPGMIELATLSQRERLQSQIDRLRKDARDHPSDPELQLALASVLLTGGQTEEAMAAFRELLARSADAPIWARAGAALMRAGQHALAKQFLERAAASSPAARLDLAMATSIADGPAKALEVLGSAPEGSEAGNYLLVKARILDAAGRHAEADAALDEGLRQSGARTEVALEAALLLVHRRRDGEALDAIAQALKSAPDDADLLLTKAIVLALMNRTPAAEKAFRGIQSRWPEWDRPYVAHGLMLESTRPQDARQKLRTAVTLNSGDSAARCALERIESSAPPDRRCTCAGGLREWLFSSCADR